MGVYDQYFMLLSFIKTLEILFLNIYKKLILE